MVCVVLSLARETARAMPSFRFIDAHIHSTRVPEDERMRCRPFFGADKKAAAPTNATHHFFLAGLDVEVEQVDEACFDITWVQ